MQGCKQNLHTARHTPKIEFPKMDLAGRQCKYIVTTVYWEMEQADLEFRRISTQEAKMTVGHDGKITEKVDQEMLEHIDATQTDMKVELVLDEARQASADEKQMSLWKAIKLYPKAVGWSVGISMALVMEGYDTALMGNFFGYPAFQSKYGVLDPTTGGYQIYRE
jgi:hypothetical protein